MPTMTSPASHRPFWKRKRWIAAAVLWLLFAYPLSLGPAIYMNGRGWIPASVVPVLAVMYRPLEALAESQNVFGDALGDMVVWLDGLAERHANSE